MNKLSKILLFVFLLGLVYFVSSSVFKKSETLSEIKPTLTPEQTNKEITASFEIYTNGTKRIFTDKRYHNQSTDVYIQSNNPNIINVKKPGTTWDDLFKTLPMKLTADCLTTGTGQLFCNGDSGNLRFFINDIENPDALKEVIGQDDKLVVTFN